MRHCWPLLLLLLNVVAFSQPNKALLDQGDKHFAKGDFDKALKTYEQLHKDNPEDAKVLFRLGVTHLSTNTKFQALPFLEKAYQINPEVDADISYYLGTAHQLHSHFNRAKRFFEEYRKKNKRLGAIALHKIRECELGDSLMRNPVLCVIKVLEWPVNSPFQDYGSVLNKDESILIFTSARDTTKTDLRYKNVFFEDILRSEKRNGVWSVPSKVSPKVNDEYHDAVTYLSPDGNTMLLYYERGNGDIYLTVFDGVEWSDPVPIEGEVNSEYWETSGCVSPDGKTLFFASDREGGYGDLDIYWCKKLDNGKWSKPLNLGPGVNTKGSEDAPFIHADGTLYFGSDGHPGLGNTDIFKSEFKEGKWQKAVNLGYPINTPESDSFFFLSEDKKRGYFSSVRHEGIGFSDICEVTFLDPPPPIEVTEAPEVAPPMEEEARAIDDEFMDSMVSLQRELGIATELIGKVLDEQTAQPIRAEILLVDNRINKVLERVYSSSETGDFKIVIPHGGNYGINTSADGYLFNSLNFEVPTFSEPQEIETAILMVKATVGSKVVMKNIFFDTGKADIKNESIPELERILDLLQRNASIKLQVNGHTDNVGDNQVNKALSLKRAEAVVNFLKGRGVEAGRLRAVGYGEERPLVSNDDEEGGREINRRTEIEVFEGEQKGG
jgi:outer membrane protein OmpA-like peptidoglycan-associated protein